MKKIINYEEAKKLLNKNCKLYYHSTTEKSWLHTKDHKNLTIRKDTFNKLLQNKIIKMKRNDFDTFNFIEMYSK